MNRTNMAAASALLLTAGVAVLPGAAQAQSSVGALDKTFAVTVSQGNNAEVMASRLALQKSTSKKVRTIATMLIQQHGQAEVSLKQVAQLEKIDLPPGTDPAHQAAYKKLKGLSGAAFDKAYITDNVTDHYKTIALFNKELNGGTDTQVRSFATKYLPAIETHTQMITAVASNYGIPIATNNADRSASLRMEKMGKSSSAEMPTNK
jgi:putative membrane protein